jgi:hypothetical protein
MKKMNKTGLELMKQYKPKFVCFCERIKIIFKKSKYDIKSKKSQKRKK